MPDSAQFDLAVTASRGSRDPCKLGSIPHPARRISGELRRGIGPKSAIFRPQFRERLFQTYVRIATTRLISARGTRTSSGDSSGDTPGGLARSADPRRLLTPQLS